MSNIFNSVNMNNRVSTANLATKSDDAKKLLKYVNNETLQDVPDTFTSAAKGGVGTAMVFEGIPTAFLLGRNVALKKGIVNDSMKELGKTNKEALKNLFKGEGKVTTRVSEYLQSANDSKKVLSEIKSTVKAEKKVANAEFRAKVKKVVTEQIAKVTEHLPKKAVKNTTTEVIKEAVEQTAKEAAKPTKLGKAIESATGFVSKQVKNATTVATNASKAFKNTKLFSALSTAKGKVLGVTSKFKASKLGKMMKSTGAGAMLIFSGVCECLTEVIPTFKELGVKKGLKQLGKSSVKVVGDTVGFIAGEQAGVAIGTAIGTAICPGIGSAIGAACGLVGGMLGSFVMGKVTKAITGGKSEREIAKENQMQKDVANIVKDENSLNALKEQTIMKLQEEMSYGELSEDGKIALAALENLEASNPFAA